MASSHRMIRLLQRAAIGAVACAILGVVIEPICFWDEPSGDGAIRLPIIGPIVGGAIGSVLAAWLGGIPFSEKTTRRTIHAWVGAIVGVLLGASAFPGLLTAWDPNPKLFGVYQQRGILAGLPIGAVLGLAVALFITPTRQTPERSGE